MQKSPPVASRAQEVWLDDDGDLMVFEHFGIVHRTGKGFQNSFGLPYSNWPTTNPANRLRQPPAG
jgi:hypothetical protein